MEAQTSRPKSASLSISSMSTSSTAYSTTSSEHSTHARCPKLILDSSSAVFTQRYIPQLSEALLSLPIPIQTVDFIPSTEVNFGGKRSGIKSGTKVRVTSASNLGSGSGELKATHIRDSLSKSLLGVGQISMEYMVAQRPDHTVAVAELTGGFGALVSEGQLSKWGVKQFPLRDVSNIVKTCDRRGYCKPKIYQGEYNVLFRPKDELIDLLKTNGMEFHAYAPTANGYLSQSTPSSINNSPSASPTVNFSRTFTNTSQMSHLSRSSKLSIASSQSSWRHASDSAPNRAAVEKIQEEASKHGITVMSASLRWLAYHSHLDENDSIVLGATHWRDLEDRVSELAKGPLPNELVQVMNTCYGK